MTEREQGFLLLTSQLGDPERKPLTVAQLRTLTLRARSMEKPLEDRDLTVSDLLALGCGREMAERVLRLLDDRELLEYYLGRGRQTGCVPITRLSESYPQALRRRLGPDAPGCLWARGDLSLLNTPAVALVGSRDLNRPNLEFAVEAGRQAALQGYTLVSGNARGADKAGQNACLEAGGRVISVVADTLTSHKVRENVLFLSEDSFDGEFSPQRALSRNRVIHCLGSVTLVAQSALQMGGTWDGTSKNLRFGWSPVFCFDDGSDASAVMEQMGAKKIAPDGLIYLDKLHEKEPSLFDQ